MAWLRLYTDILNKSKISRLPDRLFRSWIELLLAAKVHNQGGVLPPMDDLEFLLRMEGKAKVIRADLEALLVHKLVDRNADGTWTMHDWKTHQYVSDDDPTARDRKRRERDKKRPVTGDGTPDVTRDSDVTGREESRPPETETEQNRTPQPPGGPVESVETGEVERVVVEFWNCWKPLPKWHGPLPAQALERLEAVGVDGVTIAISNYTKMLTNREDYTWAASPYRDFARFLEKGLSVFATGPFSAMRRTRGASSGAPVLTAAPEKVVCTYCGRVETKSASWGGYCTNRDCPSQTSDVPQAFVSPEEFARLQEVAD